jgi:ATP-dependent Clp protease adapter protein ClpS
MMNELPLVIESPASDVDFQKFMGVVVNTKLTEEVGKPPMYAVVLHNDNSTLPDFVTEVLVKAFQLPAQRAAEVMLTAHRGGQTIVCVLAKDVAETRLAVASSMIRAAQPGRDFASSLATTCQLTFSLELETEGE